MVQKKLLSTPCFPRSQLHGREKQQRSSVQSCLTASLSAGTRSQRPAKAPLGGMPGFSPMS